MREFKGVGWVSGEVEEEIFDLPRFRLPSHSLAPSPFVSVYSFATQSVSADSKPVDLKDAVTRGDTLQDDTANLIAENEFDAAMQNNVDSTVVA